jgi:hypothetical protein
MTTAQLPEKVLTRLNTDGVSAGWVGDQIGMGQRQAAILLRKIGARQTNGRWHLTATLAKPKTYGNARACVSSPFTASDFKDGGRE